MYSKSRTSDFMGSVVYWWVPFFVERYTVVTLITLQTLTISKLVHHQFLIIKTTVLEAKTVLETYDAE